jgi:hypothetical protein
MRRLLSRLAAASFCSQRETVRVIRREQTGPPLIPLHNIHPLGRAEFAGAARAVALGIIAPGAGHRRREGFLQPRLRRFHRCRRRLVTKVRAGPARWPSSFETRARARSSG